MAEIASEWENNCMFHVDGTQRPLAADLPPKQDIQSDHFDLEKSCLFPFQPRIEGARWAHCYMRFYGNRKHTAITVFSHSKLNYLMTEYLTRLASLCTHISTQHMKEMKNRFKLHFNCWRVMGHFAFHSVSHFGNLWFWESNIGWEEKPFKGRHLPREVRRLTYLPHIKDNVLLWLAANKVGISSPVPYLSGQTLICINMAYAIFLEKEIHSDLLLVLQKALHC